MTISWPFKTFVFATMLAVSGLMMSAPASHAQTDGERAAIFIADVVGKTMSAMTEEGLTAKQQEERFRELFTTYIDIPFIGQFVAGRYWKKAGDAEQERFLTLMEDVTVLTWASRIARYSDYGMEVVGPKESSAEDTFIETNFQVPSGPPVNFIWRMAPKGESFLIRDMIIEGASMAITHRSEYQSVIRRSGGSLSGLNDALEKKVAQLRATN